MHTDTQFRSWKKLGGHTQHTHVQMHIARKLHAHTDTQARSWKKLEGGKLGSEERWCLASLGSFYWAEETWAACPPGTEYVLQNEKIGFVEFVSLVLQIVGDKPSRKASPHTIILESRTFKFGCYFGPVVVFDVFRSATAFADSVSLSHTIASIGRVAHEDTSLLKLIRQILRNF